MNSAILSAAMAMAAAASSQTEPTITDASWLIGRWTFEDRATAATGSSYVERGVRDCAWALDGRYIRCESKGVSNGKARTYVFYLNYNKPRGRFEMLSMWANVPDKVTEGLQLSPDKRTLTKLGDPYEQDGARWRSWADLTFDGDRRWAWRSGRQPDAPGAERGPVRYEDVAVRASRRRR